MGILHARYGEHPDCCGDLHLPAEPAAHAAHGRPEDGWPVVVLLHGGFWRDRYRRDLTTPMADDLAAHGVAAWNLEYRRVGGGGGWPSTLHDVAAGIDHLAVLASTAPVDAARVAVVGHSAGGQLALWAAGRAQLPVGAPGADPTLHLAAVVGQAPVASLRAAAGARLGDGAVQAFLGEGELLDERLRQADPIGLVGHGVPTLLVHGDADVDVPLAQSEAYAAAAGAAGDPVELRVVPARHMDLIDPAAASWSLARSWLLERLGTDTDGRACPPA